MLRSRRPELQNRVQSIRAGTGFHIYDVGFQSPNVEAARPLVYATAFLLVLVIVALNLTAVSIRNRLREKYRGLESI